MLLTTRSFMVVPSLQITAWWGKSCSFWISLCTMEVFRAPAESSLLDELCTISILNFISIKTKLEVLQLEIQNTLLCEMDKSLGWRSQTLLSFPPFLLSFSLVLSSSLVLLPFHLLPFLQLSSSAFFFFINNSLSFIFSPHNFFLFSFSNTSSSFFFFSSSIHKHSLPVRTLALPVFCLKNEIGWMCFVNVDYGVEERTF